MFLPSAVNRSGMGRRSLKAVVDIFMALSSAAAVKKGCRRKRRTVRMAVGSNGDPAGEDALIATRRRRLEKREEFPQE
jgi:hypothetical protein